MSRSDRPGLVTIPISHFCEKARWALDRAGLRYDERRHIQIIHQFAARIAGGGRTVPVLATSDGAFSESAAILRYADIDDTTAANALKVVDAELDAVGELLSDGRRHLAGERFTAADLAFAAPSAPLIVPAEYGTPLPQPDAMAPAMAARVRAWREHPAGRFAARMFAEHR